MRQAAAPLRVVDVATMLLVAQSIPMSATSSSEILEALRVPSPIVTITGRVAGFEETFLDLLEGGLILPGKVAKCKGTTLSRDGYGLRFSHNSDVRWHVIAFQGSEFDTEDRKRTARQVFIAARSAYPILGVSEREERLPGLLQRAARINLLCGPIDNIVIRETIRVVLGEVSDSGITHEHASALTLADLALAIRPGTSVGRALDLLDDFARMRLASAADDEDDSHESNRKDSARKESRSTTTNKPKSGRSDPGSGGERIEPTALTGTDADRFISSVETLSGYGEAKDWALNLKGDLALWRVGTLGWEDMSAKLLLSGPPGTGKTTFAKALCNTLQVPLIATSVATWMEPGYLGDVLKRMSAAFAEAEAAKPAILFVDELDGINTRGSSGEWTTYWDQIVNRLLELLDGATRSDGVIVIGATNNPERIDKALLRSGRLEKHIVIPRPDTDALIGILRHHLKDDPAHCGRHRCETHRESISLQNRRQRPTRYHSHRCCGQSAGNGPPQFACRIEGQSIMVTFSPRTADHDGSFDYQLARLTALKADIEKIQRGVPPERLAADPPILERWVMAQRPALCLAGLSFEHPLLTGQARPIVTSDLCLIADDHTWARTLSRWYRLGRPASSPLRDL